MILPGQGHLVGQDVHMPTWFWIFVVGAPLAVWLGVRLLRDR